MVKPHIKYSNGNGIFYKKGGELKLFT